MKSDQHLTVSKVRTCEKKLNNVHFQYLVINTLRYQRLGHGHPLSCN